MRVVRETFCIGTLKRLISNDPIVVHTYTYARARARELLCMEYVVSPNATLVARHMIPAIVGKQKSGISFTFFCGRSLKIRRLKISIAITCTYN